jgi:TetR/AcrR family transcriptional regulator, regulator of biofilm formation and stress response
VNEPRTAEPEARPMRGERREAILGATVRLLAERGLAAVTHRAVAAEADVPLAATTYYFSSKEEMVAEALELLAAAEVERLTETAARLGARIGSPEDAAAEVVETLFPGGEEAEKALIAKYEVLVEAARRPALRPAVAQLASALRSLGEAVLRAGGGPEPERRAWILVAGAHGILIEAIGSGRADRDRDELVGRFRELFALLLTD